jgi:hypothetical protein
MTEAPLAVTEAWVANWYGIRVRLYRDGERWFMYVGKAGKGKRRKDFASPFLGHAKRTVAAWYGIPVDVWRRDLECPVPTCSI